MNQSMIRHTEQTRQKNNLKELKEEENAMKKTLHLLPRILLPMLLVFCLVLSGCGSKQQPTNPTPGSSTPSQSTTPTTPPDTVYVLKYGTAWAETQGDASYMLDLIEERSGGRIKVERYFAGSLVTAGEEIEALQSGIIDMNFVQPPYYMGDLRLGNWTFGVPFVAANAYDATKVNNYLWEHSPELRNEFEKYGFVAWPAHTFGDYDLVTIYPVNSIGDLSGHTINFAFQSALWGKAVGCSTVSINMADLFTSLQSGVCEGGNWSSDIILNYSLVDAGCKYLTTADFGCRVGGHPCIRQEWWNALPADLQKIVDECIAEAQQYGCALALEYEDKLANNPGLAGTYDPSDADIVNWANLCVPAVKSWTEELDAAGYDGLAYLQLIQDAHEAAGAPMLVDYVSAIKNG